MLISSALFVAGVGFAVTASGLPRSLAGLAATCFVAVLAGSGTGFVPIQRRLVDAGSDPSAAAVDQFRRRWLGAT
jgi:hypothetical protein